MKTPLRYPGGKSRALKKLNHFLPDLNGYTEWREPFLGGGSMSIDITKRYPDIKVWVNVNEAEQHLPITNYQDTEEDAYCNSCDSEQKYLNESEFSMEKK